MKNRLVVIVLVLLVLVSSVTWAKETEPQVIGSDTITFRGFIEAGLYFAVSPLTDESFNLLTTEELLPTGDGVDVGRWTLRVDNPPVTTTTFTIRYEYEPIRNTDDAITDEIEFIVLEREETETLRTEKSSGSETVVSISATEEMSTVSRIFSARLTDDGASAALTAAASPDYIAYITVSLESE
jgi:hypothetical protein